MIPDFSGIENGETDNLETTLQKLCDPCVCASVQDNVGHDVVSLEVMSGMIIRLVDVVELEGLTEMTDGA